MHLHILQEGLYQTFCSCWNFSLLVCPRKKRLIAFLPLAVCWGVWKIQNAKILNGTQLLPARAISHVLDFLRSISLFKPFNIQPFSVQLFHRMGGLSSSPSSHQVIILERPTHLRLNINGSSNCVTGNSGGGIILRDANRAVIFVASLFLGKASSVNAEIMVLAHGLAMLFAQNCCIVMTTIIKRCMCSVKRTN